jgi:hypothetical protein
MGRRLRFFGKGREFGMEVFLLVGWGCFRSDK